MTEPLSLALLPGRRWRPAGCGLFSASSLAGKGGRGLFLRRRGNYPCCADNEQGRRVEERVGEEEAPEAEAKGAWPIGKGKVDLRTPGMSK